ncbi:hypothetical protein [Arthrobacter dokdonensis]|uniref:hypothetical protein n=1 Tax=Arthrobacter dokdonellae TaxID=2211210 RepID=UPI001D130884|nr:hypothetical protein [Arthrobacter dokdonellae]
MAATHSLTFGSRCSAEAGEFDGRGKYLRKDWAGGRSLQDRIMAEKNREDQIRARMWASFDGHGRR